MPSFPDKTPPLNATGRYVLRLPFTCDITIDYRAEALDGFEALEERGIDVFQEYYAPHGLNKSIYSSDSGGGINIVTIMSADAQTINVPSSHIISYPFDTSLPHSRLIIAVDAGLLPDGYVMDDVVSACATLVRESIGNDAVATLHRIPVTGFVSKAEGSALDNARASIRGSIPTDGAARTVLENRVAKLESVNSTQKEIIKNKLP